jgi:hypothetical protein
MSGQRPAKVLTESEFSHHQIANVLRMAGAGNDVVRVSYSSDLLPGLGWNLIDTGTRPMTWQPIGDDVIHVLYAMNEPACRVEINGVSMPIAPGDTIRFGSNSKAKLSDGVLALHVQSDNGSPSRDEPPSHGIEHFVGFNRQTIYATGSEIELERWKLTVPLDLELDRNAAFVVLFGNVSVIRSGSVETLGPGESIVCVAGHLRVFPDGLAYIAIIRRPLPRE